MGKSTGNAVDDNTEKKNCTPSSNDEEKVTEKGNSQDVEGKLSVIDNKELPSQSDQEKSSPKENQETISESINIKAINKNEENLKASIQITDINEKDTNNSAFVSD